MYANSEEREIVVRPGVDSEPTDELSEQGITSADVITKGVGDASGLCGHNGRSLVIGQCDDAIERSTYFDSDCADAIMSAVGRAE